MSLQDHIRSLIAHGLEPAVAGTIAAEIYAAGVAAASVRSDGAARTRRWRERRGTARSEADAVASTALASGEGAVSPNVTERHPPSPGDASYREENYRESQVRDSEESIAGSTASLSSPRPMRLPANWAPAAADIAFAKSEGLGEGDIAREAMRFRNYWHGKTGLDAVKRDWTAAWQNWARTCAHKFLGRAARRATRGLREAGTNAGAGATAALSIIPERMSIEDAVALFARSGVWSRYAPGGEPGLPSCRASVELLAKHGLAPDGRRLTPFDAHET